MFNLRPHVSETDDFNLFASEITEILAESYPRSQAHTIHALFCRYLSLTEESRKAFVLAMSAEIVATHTRRKYESRLMKEDRP